MPEHYTKSTVEASVWCPKCAKMTPHRIDSGRRGPCIPCLATPPAPKPEASQAEQLDLFGRNKQK